MAECLRFHPEFLDNLGYKEQRPGGLTDQELARAINVALVLIAKSVFNSAKKAEAAWLDCITLFGVVGSG